MHENKGRECLARAREDLESWRVGELESWRIGELENWGVGELAIGARLRHMLDRRLDTLKHTIVH